MRIASIQLEMIEGESKTSRIAHVKDMIDKAALNNQGEPDIDLILLPELWNVGFFEHERFKKEAESSDGPTYNALAEKAFKYNTYIHGGTIVEKDNGNLYNTALFISPKGELLAKYRKIHLFTHFGAREGEYITPGKESVVIKTDLFNFGLTTCYDLRFPELYRRQVEAGAEIFLVTACWSFPRLENWVVLNQARATENVAYLISCNAVGKVKGERHLGHSMVVDPWGIKIASAGSRETILTAEIDPAAVKKIRKQFPALKDKKL
ncbi:MAG: carbon-nitrogen family hydrolase [Bacillota bacterium]